MINLAVMGQLIAKVQDSGIFRLVSVNIPNGSTLLPDLYSLTYNDYLKFTFSDEIYEDVYPDESSYFWTNFLFDDLTIADPASIGVETNKKIVGANLQGDDRRISTPCVITVLDGLLNTDLEELDKEYEYSYPITLNGTFTYTSSNPTVGGTIPNDTTVFRITFPQNLGDLSSVRFVLGNVEETIDEELTWDENPGGTLVLTRPTSDILPADSYLLSPVDADITDIHGRTYIGGDWSYTVEE